MKPDLHGSRVVLRSIQMDDSDDLFEIYGDIQTDLLQPDWTLH